MTQVSLCLSRHMPGSLLLAACTAVSAAPVVLSTSQEAAIVGSQYADQTSTAFGGGYYLVLNMPKASDETVPPRSIGLVQFDVSAYTGQTVDAATLSLFKDSNRDPGGVYSIFRITSAWTPSNSFTFNSSAPTYDPTPVASLTFGEELDVYRDWNVSSLLQGWLNGTYTNHGLWIERQSGGENMAYLRSSLFGPATAPRLTIALADDGDPRNVPEPTPLALLVVAGLAAWVVRRAAPVGSAARRA